jgi:hypothetical protein
MTNSECALATPVSVKIISALILIATLGGFGLLGVIGVTGVRTAMTINVGSVNSQVNGASESISIPVSLTNPGPLSLNGIDVTIAILDVNGTLLSTGGGGPLSLSPGSSGQLPISISFDLNQLPQSTLQTLATTSENLTLRASLAASVSSFTSFTATVDTPSNWGAPISNLQLGVLTTSTYNATFAMFSIPMSFMDNSQYFSVNGTVGGTILGQSGSTVGTITPQNIDVGTQSSFSDQLTGYISQSAITQSSVTVQLVFQTSFGTITEDVVESA